MARGHDRARSPLPLAYACSGCSNVAQLANDIALELTRRGIAQMSCIAGVGGDVPSLVKLARSGRTIIALDGCPLQCVTECLARHAVKPDHHLTLTDLGIRKRGMELDAEDDREHALRNAFVDQIADDLSRESARALGRW